MRKHRLLAGTLLLVLAAILAVMPVEAKKKKADGEAIPRFKEQTFDFGMVKEQGGPVSHEFEFTNVGNGNLVVIEATAECGCTRPDYPKKPIAPGKTGKIKVTYNPIGRPGAFDKVVTVKTNGKPKKVRLKIRGTVTPSSKK